MATSCTRTGTGAAARTLAKIMRIPACFSMLILLASGGCYVQADETEKLLFLVMEEDEVIASNTKLGRFDRLKMSAKEKVLEHKTANAVAVVITNQRYVAYGVYPGGWNSLRRIAGERFESMEVADYSATLVTSDRILNFYGRTGTWSHTRR